MNVRSSTLSLIGLLLAGSFCYGEVNDLPLGTDSVHRTDMVSATNRAYFSGDDGWKAGELFLIEKLFTEAVKNGSLKNAATELAFKNDLQRTIDKYRALSQQSNYRTPQDIARGLPFSVVEETLEFLISTKFYDTENRLVLKNEIIEAMRNSGRASAGRIYDMVAASERFPEGENHVSLVNAFNQTIGVAAHIAFNQPLEQSLLFAKMQAEQHLEDRLKSYRSEPDADKQAMIGIEIKAQRFAIDLLERRMKAAEKGVALTEREIRQAGENFQTLLRDCAKQQSVKLDKNKKPDAVPPKTLGYTKEESAELVQSFESAFGAFEGVAGRVFNSKETSALFGSMRAVMTLSRDLDKADLLKTAFAGGVAKLTAFVNLGMALAELSGLLPNPNAAIFAELRAIREDIAKLSVQINDGFMSLSKQMLDQYRDLMRGLGDIDQKVDVVVQNSRLALAELQQQRAKLTIGEDRFREDLIAMMKSQMANMDSKCFDRASKLRTGLSVDQYQECVNYYANCGFVDSKLSLYSGSRIPDATETDFFLSVSAPIDAAQLYGKLGYYTAGLGKSLNFSLAEEGESVLNLERFQMCERKFVFMARAYPACYRNFIDHSQDPKNNINSLIRVAEQHVAAVAHVDSGPGSMFGLQVAHYGKTALRASRAYREHAKAYLQQKKYFPPTFSAKEMAKHWSTNETAMRAYTADAPIPKELGVCPSWNRLPQDLDPKHLRVDAPDDLSQFMHTGFRQVYLAAEKRGLGDIEYCVSDVRWTHYHDVNIERGSKNDGGPPTFIGMNGRMYVTIKGTFRPKSGKAPIVFFSRVLINPHNRAVWAFFASPNRKEGFGGLKNERWQKDQVVQYNGGLNDWGGWEEWQTSHLKAELDNFWPKMRPNFFRDSVEFTGDYFSPPEAERDTSANHFHDGMENPNITTAAAYLNDGDHYQESPLAYLHGYPAEMLVYRATLPLIKEIAEEIQTSKDETASNLALALRFPGGKYLVAGLEPLHELGVHLTGERNLLAAYMDFLRGDELKTDFLLKTLFSADDLPDAATLSNRARQDLHNIYKPMSIAGMKLNRRKLPEKPFPVDAEKSGLLPPGSEIMLQTSTRFYDLVKGNGSDSTAEFDFSANPEIEVNEYDALLLKIKLAMVEDELRDPGFRATVMTSLEITGAELEGLKPLFGAIKREESTLSEKAEAKNLPVITAHQELIVNLISLYRKTNPREAFKPRRPNAIDNDLTVLYVLKTEGNFPGGIGENVVPEQCNIEPKYDLGAAFRN